MSQLKSTCKKLITDTVTTNIKRTAINSINEFMKNTGNKALRVVKSKIGYCIYFSDDDDMKKVYKLIKKFDPEKFKENSVFQKTSSYRRGRAEETLNSNANFNIKIPDCKAFMKIHRQYGDSLNLFIYGPDAKTVYKLLLIHLEKEDSEEKKNSKNSKHPSRVYTIDTDFDGDFILRGGNKTSIKSLDTIYTDAANKSKITNYLSKWQQSSALFKDLNISYKLGILLYGPPGTGKTSMAKAISTLLGYDIYSVNMNHFVASLIPDIKSYAEDKKGMIILLEDIDYIFGKREKEFTQEEKARSNALLQLLDGADSMPNVVFIATTNDINSLDDAITRDGRFDLKIIMDNLDEPTAKDMCSGLYLSPEQTKEVLSTETFPINPAYLQNKIIQYIFSHIESMNFSSSPKENNSEEDEFSELMNFYN